MTKGELMSNCLKLLNENDGEEIKASMVSSLDEYKERTTVMIPSINRALNRLAVMKKLPGKTATIKYDANQKSKTIEVSGELIKDLLYVSNVVLFDKDYGMMETNVGYFLDEETFILPPLNFDEWYKIFYYPQSIQLKDTDADTMELPYSDYILNCIPYFVKADLYEEDNPNVALLSRNLFEQYAEAIPTRNLSVMRGTRDVYNLY
jgi:hypothetical protein